MTEKKIILFIPSIEGGGVEKNFFIISRFLAQKKKSVFLITAEKKLLNKTNNIKIVNPKINFWRKGTRLRKYIICILLLIKLIIKNRNCFVFSFQANVYAIIICKIFRVKIIARSNSSPSGWSSNFLKKTIFKIFFKLADRLIVNSKEFKKEMNKNYSVNPKVIYNPFDKKKIVNFSNIKIQKKFQSNKLKIITVGRLVDQKNHLCLLKALNNIKDKIKFELIIIGKGKNYYQIKDYSFNNNLNKDVRIMYTNNPFPLIKQSDLFILTSKYEGLPNVLLEAIALKKFIISSDCPTGPKEILDNGKGGYLFKNNDYKSLSAKILKFVNNKKYLKNKIAYAHKRLNRFDYKKNLIKYLNVINSI
jgi:glycosyltransferase involved in cell wall biosynthesis